MRGEEKLEEEEGKSSMNMSIISKSDQRTLYLVNIFILETARFLNRFSSICQDKLATIHRRILGLEASLTLLEAQLTSIENLQQQEEYKDDTDAAGPSSSSTSTTNVQSSDFRLSTNAQQKSSTLSISSEGPSE